MVVAEGILEAYYICIIGKRSSGDALRFQTDFFGNIQRLIDEVETRSYQPLPSITFVLTKPVFREVFAANFRDRIIHTWIALRLEPLYEQEFSDRTFNCRKGKGQLFGVKMLAHDIKVLSHDNELSIWYLKCDLKGFFMSIPKRKLAEVVDAFIVEHYFGEDKETLRYLSWETIMNDPTKNCKFHSPKLLMDKVPQGKSLFHNKKGYGVPIGNLTSQHNANKYLNPFDWWIEMALGIYYHGRYVDDFYLLHPDKDYLLSCIPKIRAYLKDELGVTLHPKKIMLQRCECGIKFTGMVCKKGRIYVSNRTVSNFENLIYYINNHVEDINMMNLEKYVASINSYLGLMQHTKSYAIRRRIMGQLDSRFFKFVYGRKHFNSLRIKKKYRFYPSSVKILKNKCTCKAMINDCYTVFASQQAA